MHRITTIMVLVVFALSGLMGSGCASGKAQEKAQDPPRIEKLRLQITKVRNAIDETRDTIAQSRGAEFLPELYVRLAELISEEARYHYQLAYEREQRSSKVLHVPQVRLLKEDAIGIYKSVLQRFPDSPLIPRVLFNIGHEHRELGNYDKMQVALEKLANDHPDSPLAKDALLVLGDYHFDKTEYDRADAFYSDIVKGDLSRVTGLAHYKRAWVRVNRGNCETALREFESALDTSNAWNKKVEASGGDIKKDVGVSAQQDIDVRREALVDLTYCYSTKRKASNSVDYLQKRAYDRPTYVAALRRLASRYRLMDKYEGAILVSRELLELGPASEDRLDDARTLFTALKQEKEFDRVGQDMRLMSDVLTRYYSRIDIPADQRERILTEFESYLRDLATTAQERMKRASGSSKIAIARRLADGYQAYLDTFPASQWLPEMLLNMADVMEAAQRPLDAGIRANQAAQLLPADSDQRKNALYDAIVYFQESLKQESDRNQYERVTARAKLRRAGAQFLAFPIDKERERRVKFAVAQTFFDEGNYVEAIDRLTAVAYEFPQTEEADASIQLVLDSYRTINDYDGLMYASRRFIGDGTPASDSLQPKIQSTLDAAEQRKLDELSLAAAGEDGGDFSQLEEFAERNKGSELGARALTNAFVAARAVGDTDQVYELAEKLAQNYPNSDQLPGIYASLAKTASARYEFQRAVEFLEKAAAVNEGQRTQLLTTAGEVLAQLGRTSESEQMFREAVASTEQPGQSGALGGLARLVERHYGPGAVYNKLEDFQSTADPELQARLGMALLGMSRPGEAEIAFNKVLQAEGYATLEASARAQFGMAEVLVSSMEQYPDPDSIASLQEFIALIELSQQEYLTAARQGSPLITAASLSRLSVVSTRAADRLENLDPPADLPSAQKEQVRQAIQTRVDSLRTAAEDAMAACQEQAWNSYNFTPPVRSCLKGSLLEEPVVPMDQIQERNSAASPEGADELRQQLSKNPEDVEGLRKLAIKFMKAGDFHAARLVLSDAVDVGGGPREQNLLGIARYKIGDVGGGLEAFALAAEGGLPAGVANLRSVLQTKGMREAAQAAKDRYGVDADPTEPLINEF
jgi:tetratricopeptide (TPR) repeat protein